MRTSDKSRFVGDGDLYIIKKDAAYYVAKAPLTYEDCEFKAGPFSSFEDAALTYMLYY